MKVKKGKDRQMFRFCQKAEKVVEHTGDGDVNCSRRAWNCSKSLDKRLVVNNGL